MILMIIFFWIIHVLRRRMQLGPLTDRFTPSDTIRVTEKQSTSLLCTLYIHLSILYYYRLNFASRSDFVPARKTCFELPFFSPPALCTLQVLRIGTSITDKSVSFSVREQRRLLFHIFLRLISMSSTSTNAIQLIRRVSQ